MTNENEYECMINMEEFICQDLQPQVKKETITLNGKFKTKYENKVPLCECCGYSIGNKRYSFCPNCGARVIGD